MNCRWFRRLAVTCTFATTLSLTVTQVQAGPFIDWLKAKHNPPASCAGGNCAYPAAGAYPVISGNPAIPTNPVYTNYAYSAYYPYNANYAYVGAPAPYTAAYPTAAAAYYPQRVGYAPAATGYAPTIAGYAPATAGYAPVATAYNYNTPYTPPLAYRPFVAGYRPNTVIQPVTAYQGVMAPGGVAAQPYYGAVPIAGCPTYQPYQQPQTVGYAPNTNFNSAYIPVPTTYYRQITGINPVTGQPATIVQPCITTNYQLQRSPALIQSPVVYGTQNYAATCGPGGCGPGRCGVAAPVAGAPYYTPNAPLSGTGAPYILSPNNAPLNNGISTGPVLPPTMSQPGFSTGPVSPYGGAANQSPTLNPQGTITTGPQQGVSQYPATTQYPPGTQYPPTVENTYPNNTTIRTMPSFPTTPSIQPQNNSAYPSSPTTPGTTTNPPPYYSNPNGGTTTVAPTNPTFGDSNNTTTTPPPVVTTPPYSSSSSSSPTEDKLEMPFKAVPDPDPETRTLNKVEDNNVPNLISPRDRSAAIPQRRPLVLSAAKLSEYARMSAAPQQMNAPQTNAVPTANVSTPKKVDDSGWVSSGR